MINRDAKDGVIFSIADGESFSRSLTIDQRKAIEQYIVDHAVVQKNGYLGVQFYVRDIQDFYDRLAARKDSSFARYDKDTKYKIQLIKKKEFEKHWSLFKRYRYIATHPVIVFVAKLLWIY